MSLSGKFISKFSSICCFTFGIAIIFTFFVTNDAYCQYKSPATNITPDSSGKSNDTVKLSATNLPDSLKKNNASANDTSKRKQLEEALGIKISKDEMPSVIKAEARDSAILNMKQNLFYLYG